MSRLKKSTGGKQYLCKIVSILLMAIWLALRHFAFPKGLSHVNMGDDLLSMHDPLERVDALPSSGKTDMLSVW